MHQTASGMKNAIRKAGGGRIRLMGLSVWIFLNLILIGMGAYLYLLWVQYWHYADTTKMLVAQSRNFTNPVRSSDTMGHGSGDVREIVVRPGRPRFHFLRMQQPPTQTSSTSPTPTPTPTPTQTPNLTTTTPIPRDLLLKMIEKHKMALTVHLRTAQMDGGNILFKHENRYGVKFRGRRIQGNPDKDKLLCELKGTEVRSLRDGDEPFTSQGVAKHFPSTNLLEGRHFNTCVVVSSAGSLRGSRLGNFIGEEVGYLSFILGLKNHAPTEGFEEDVGSRTTLRIVNSQVVTKPEFDFWGSPLYSDVALLVWDPCNYTATLQEWYESPDFDLFPVYFRRRLMLPQEDLHLLHPKSLWKIWDVLQRNSFSRILQNPPSSGFLGVVLMMSHCETVDAVEFVPSLRLTKQCHYWDPATDSGCTFGLWHPLATEKLLSLVMNEANDEDTYHKGFIRIPGFKQLKCPTHEPGR
ncbi:beta-galactoside alpha-2,6-sialyltransferase 1 [Macrobrachium rosenbergii]|uniref:beta-galactoside alpha-2,6-sialyltransferase 1 n=1 Tax=Macrobrachium rosenbergii TaxID=79674 RepID=UPI0034D723E0